MDIWTFLLFIYCPDQGSVAVAFVTETPSARHAITLTNENAWALTRPPATCPPCQYSCPELSQLTSYIFTKWICAIYTGHTIKKSKISFFNMALTLTFKLIQDLIKVNVPTNFQVGMSNRSTVRALNNRQTDRHTDRHTGPILYPWPLTPEGMSLSLFC